MLDIPVQLRAMTSAPSCFLPLCLLHGGGIPLGRHQVEDALYALPRALSTI